MQFENVNFQNLISQFKAFSVEGFNIFGTGEDDLPRLVCVCPNKQFARAIQSLLEIAKRAQTVEVVTAEIHSNCYLTPMLLAVGTLALVATVIDDAVWKDGNEVEYEDLELHIGSSEYQNSVTRLLGAHRGVPPQNDSSTLHIYEDTIMHRDHGEDEFPF